MLKLYSHQREGVKYALSVQHPVLWWEMRCGKNLVVIRTTKRRQGRVLVVAPFGAWVGWEDMLHSDNVPCVFIEGTWQRRCKLLDNAKNNEWIIVNPEGYRARGIAKRLRSILWGTVIFDEENYIQNQKTGITKFWTSNFRDVPHRWILTGTPRPNSLLDIHQPLAFADPSILKYDYYRWRFYNFTPRRSGTGGSFWVPRENTEKRVAEALTGKVSRLTRHDCGYFTEKVFEQRVCNFPPAARRSYAKLEREFILEWMGKEVSRTRFSVAKYQWLRKLAAGIVDNELVWDGKIKELLHLLDTQFGDQQIIVCCGFTVGCKYLTQKIGEGHRTDLIHGDTTLKRRIKIQDAFVKGRFDVLVANPTCIRMGGDYSVADTIIYYTLPDSPLTWMQVQDRTVRLDKKTPTLHIEMIVRNTVEESIRKGLHQKKSKQELWDQIILDAQRRVDK